MLWKRNAYLQKFCLYCTGIWKTWVLQKFYCPRGELLFLQHLLFCACVRVCVCVCVCVCACVCACMFSCLKNNLWFYFNSTSLYLYFGFVLQTNKIWRYNQKSVWKSKRASCPKGNTTTVTFSTFMARQ